MLRVSPLWTSLLLLLAACGAPSAAPSPPRSQISAAEAEALLIRADDARAGALAGSGLGQELSDSFAAGALKVTRARVKIFRERGQRHQVEPVRRQLVHFSASDGVAEAVLEVRARERSLQAGEPEAAWANTLRQWWARLEPGSGGWRIVEDHDLPPERWWRT